MRRSSGGTWSASGASASASLPRRARAPELSGAGGWIGLEEPLSLKELRGKVVLLHFWTYSCVNCLRVLGELRRLEQRFPDELVVVGVHSPRLPRERDHDAVVAAVGRHRITHPVLDDPELVTWDRYAVRAWPTLVLIDPRGYVVGTVSGEGHGRALGKVIAEMAAEQEAKGTLAGEPLDVDRLMLPDGLLAFPAKVAVSGDGRRLGVADAAHDQVLVCTIDGLVLEAHTGFAGPQGVRFEGDSVLVCDTGAGRVVRTDGVVVADGMAAPWDVVVDGDGSVVMADAGRHRLVRVRPGEHRVLVVAGTGEEGLEDGPATQALLAQPSGIALTPDGAVFVDAEASALRLLTRAGEVVTLVGEGLVDWGAEDGGPDVARLQHPQGIAASPDGESVYVADTFNSLLRVWDGATLRTLPVGGLDEPGGLDVLPDGRLVVADTNHHRLVVVNPSSGHAETLELDDAWLMSTAGPALSARSGEMLTVGMRLDLADEDLDLSGGDAVTISVEAHPAWLLADGPSEWSLAAADGEVELRAGGPGEGLLLMEVVAATIGGKGPAERVRRFRHDFLVT